mmetsp:Transcript_51016/g.163256  ORF Transcript_51016/g.163256 Transcript_51016/m.163256 type:complete len:725 (+) Transcript_51016:72-2246(+)
MQGSQEEVLVLRGPSQAGKSTLMAKVMTPGQGDGPAVGDGSGESVTRDTALRNTTVGRMLDGPGDGDSLLRFTDQEAGRRYAVGVAAAHATRVKFLVFESMGGDRMELRATLASLVTTFGAGALDGVVVVLSKADLRPGTAGQRKVAAVQRIMQEQGLKELVLWQSQGLGEEGEEAQLNALRLAVQRVRGTSPSDLADLWQRQRLRAQELFDSQAPQTKQVDVQEEYARPYEEQEAYTEQEPYEGTEVTTTPVQQSRQVWEPPHGPFLEGITFSEDGSGASEEDVRAGSKGAFIFPRFEWTSDINAAVRGFSFVMGGGPAPAGYEKIGFDLNKGARGSFNYLCVTRQGNEPPVSAVTFLKFGAAFGGTQYNQWRVFPQDLLVNGGGKFVYVGFQQAQGHYRTVTETVQQSDQVKVTKFRKVTRHRTVTRYATATRTVSKPVEYTLPIENFFQLALDQVMTEIRASFACGVSSRGDNIDIGPEDSISMAGVGPVASEVAPSSHPAGNPSAGASAALRGAPESQEGSWISIHTEAKCFMPDTLFRTWANPSSPDQGVFFQSARDLVKGSFVANADETRTLEVISIKAHPAEHIVQLDAGGDVAPLKVTPSHRVAVPGDTACGLDFCPAGNLKEGDRVLCSGGTARELTHAAILTEEATVMEILFHPDEAVAVFHAPSEMILTKGQDPQNKTKKPCRRSGMNRRGRGALPGQEGEQLSVPDTAWEFA